MTHRSNESADSFSNGVTKPRSHQRPIRDGLINARRVSKGFWLAAPVALMSGGVMMTAGCVMRTHGSGTASLATIPGGVLIMVAFGLARRRRPARGPDTMATPALSGMRTATNLLKNFGLPGDLSPRSRFVALSLTMAAGAVMILGGYSGAEQRWTSAAALALIGGLLISGAFATVVRGSVQDHRPNGMAPYGIRVASPGGSEEAPPARKRPMV
jgi:hypothetical protein